MNNFLDDTPTVNPIMNMANNVMQYGEGLKNKIKSKMDERETT